MTFPGGSDGKASVYHEGDPDLILGLGRSPGGGNGSPLQYSCLENPMGGGAWWATVHGVVKSQTRLSDSTTTNNREGTKLHPSTEYWIKALLRMARPNRTRPSFPLSQSLPSGSFHKPLILLHQREDRLKITIT